MGLKYSSTACVYETIPIVLEGNTINNKKLGYFIMVYRMFFRKKTLKPVNSV